MTTPKELAEKAVKWRKRAEIARIDAARYKNEGLGHLQSFKLEQAKAHEDKAKVFEEAAQMVEERLDG